MYYYIILYTSLSYMYYIMISLSCEPNSFLCPKLRFCGGRAVILSSKCGTDAPWQVSLMQPGATIKNKQIGGIVRNDILHPNSSIYMYLLVITCPTVPRSFDIPGSCTGWSWAMRSWRAISWAWWKPNRMIGCPGRTHAPGTAQIQNLLLQFKT